MNFIFLENLNAPAEIIPPGHINYQSPGSASLNVSEKSYSEGCSMSQQSSQISTEEDSIYPSAIRYIVSSDGRKYSPQCLHFKFIV